MASNERTNKLLRCLYHIAWRTVQERQPDGNVHFQPCRFVVLKWHQNVCGCACMWVCMHVCVCVCACMCVSACACMRMCVYVCMSVCVSVHWHSMEGPDMWTFQHSGHFKFIPSTHILMPSEDHEVIGLKVNTASQRERDGDRVVCAVILTKLALCHVLCVGGCVASCPCGGRTCTRKVTHHHTC